LVHGNEAAAAADAAAEVLFGGDPRDADAATMDMLAGELACTEMSTDGLSDLVEVLVTIGLASSRGDARRTIDGRGFRCNGVVLDADTDLASQSLLAGGYLLLQKGRRSHHLVRIFP